MKEEEKKAIELLEWTQINKLYIDTHNNCDYHEIHNAIQTVLNLIETQKAEIEKKEKIINLMAEKLVEDTDWYFSEFDCYTKEDFIKYFTKLAEEEK